MSKRPELENVFLGRRAWIPDGTEHVQQVDDIFSETVAVDRLCDAYEGVALGIHDDVQEAVQNGTPLPRVVTRASGFANGRTSAWVSRFVVGPDTTDRQQEPEYLTEYKTVRQSVFRSLVTDSFKTSDFSFLLATITNLGDPMMAKALLTQLDLGEARFPDAVAGNVRRVNNRINAYNRHVRDMAKAKHEFGVVCRDKKLQARLRDEQTGMLGALAIGFKTKTQIGVRKAVEESMYDPLRKVAQLKPIEEQILAHELAGISILED